MARSLCAWGLLIGSLLVVGCGGPKQNGVDETRDTLSPLAVIVDTILDGEFFGQRLNAPYGAAVDFRGRLFITDAGNHRLLAFTDSLVPQREVGGFGGEAGLFNRPGFVTVDNGLTLLIADRGNVRLTRYNANLTFVNEIDLINTDDPGQFGEPSGVALNQYGEIWMADLDRDRIAIFNSADQFDRYIAEFGYTGGQVSAPHEIIELQTNGFLVCDAGNARISQFDAYGNHVRTLGQGELSYPVAAAVDADERIWIVDTQPTRLVCLSRTGEYLYDSPSLLTGLDRALAQPSDIAVLKDGRLLLVDSGNNRLIIIRPLFTDN